MCLTHAQYWSLTLPGNSQLSGCSFKEELVPRVTSKATETPIGYLIGDPLVCTEIFVCCTSICIICL